MSDVIYTPAEKMEHVIEKLREKLTLAEERAEKAEAERDSARALVAELLLIELPVNEWYAVRDAVRNTLAKVRR